MFLGKALAAAAIKGYSRAGFEVVGVDIAPQPNYPFRFIQYDALVFLDIYARGRCWDWGLDHFDAIHASPPCQDYSRALRHMAAPQPRLIPEVRKLLKEIDVPWVIENVVGSPLVTHPTVDGRFGVELCGTMFGQRIQRHRLFETNFPVFPPGQCDHSQLAMNPHNRVGRERIISEFGDIPTHIPWNQEHGTGWMTRDRRVGSQFLPP